jgi:hypothetical protein
MVRWMIEHTITIEVVSTSYHEPEPPRIWAITATRDADLIRRFRWGGEPQLRLPLGYSEVEDLKSFFSCEFLHHYY